MSLSVETLAVSRKYTDDSLAGAGAVAGVPCKIQSITAITGGNRVTFLWTDNNGDDHTSAMDVMNGVDGEDGKGIQSVTVNAQDHLIITYTDGTTVDAGQIEIHNAVDSVNGQTGAVVLAIPSKTSDLTNDSGFATTSDVSTALADYTTTADLTTLLAAKQDTLTFDNAPTENSNNPVKSGGVYAVKQTLESKIANEIATRTKVSGHNIGKITNPSKTGLTGLDFTVNSDGTIKVNGTSTAAWSFIMNNALLLKAGSYILSSGIGANPNLYVQVTSVDQSASIASTANSAEKTFTLNADTIVVYRLFYLSGQTFNNVVVKPMIRLATDESADYEPYSMTNKEMTPYVQAISNPNLLDNPWFTVNQRGFSSKNDNGFTVDRWQILQAAGTVSLSNGAITIDPTVSGTTFLWGQTIEDAHSKLAGKTVTLSVMLSDGTIKSKSFDYPTDSPSSRMINNVHLGSTHYFELYEYSSGHARVGYFNDGGAIPSAPITIKAVKLELGSVSTLAMDTVPNYTTELLKCQRYFFRKTVSGGVPIGFGFSTEATTARLAIILPVSMRAIPTVAVDTVGNINIVQNGAVHAASAASVVWMQENICALNLTTTGLQGNNYPLSARDGGVAQIELSADL